MSIVRAKSRIGFQTAIFRRTSLNVLTALRSLRVGSAALVLQDAGLQYSSGNPQTRACLRVGTLLAGWRMQRSNTTFPILCCEFSQRRESRCRIESG